MANDHKNIPLAAEGLPFIIGFLAAATLLVFLPHPIFKFLAGLCFLLGIFCLNFFRDPNRSVPTDPMYLLSAADGTVTEVTTEKTPYFSEPARVVKIFLSVFDVHIQRSPLAGQVTDMEYRSGKFLDARDPSAALCNECNTFVIENENQKVVVKQVAGLIARRIVPWAKKGMTLRQGERIGLIRFGSQVNMVFAGKNEILVKPGDRVTGGLTVIAVDKSLSALPSQGIARI